MTMSKILVDGRKFNAEYKFAKVGWELKRDVNRIIAISPKGMKHYICEQCSKMIRVSHSTKKHRICARCIRIGRIP